MFEEFESEALDGLVVVKATVAGPVSADIDPGAFDQGVQAVADALRQATNAAMGAAKENSDPLFFQKMAEVTHEEQVRAIEGFEEQRRDLKEMGDFIDDAIEQMRRYRPKMQ